MNKRKTRDWLRLAGALLFCWLYLPHILLYSFGIGCVKYDVLRLRKQLSIRMCAGLAFIYHIHNNRYFRSCRSLLTIRDDQVSPLYIFSAKIQVSAVKNPPPGTGADV